MRGMQGMLATILVASVVALPGFSTSSKLEASKLASQDVAQDSSIPSARTMQRAHDLSAWTSSNRRELHKCPELLYDLEETSKYVRGVLDGLGIPYQFPVARNGIVAQIGKGSPCVALRADMDALPIHEEIDGPFQSQTAGKMHACGHDAHTAMLLTAARILKERETSGELVGTVKLLFQPAEEGGAGGLAMVQAGVMTTAPAIERVFALHVWPGLPSGTVATRPGTIMAAAGFYHATMIGHGGHAAMPHTVVDPFPCVAAALSGLQTVVSRNLEPTEAGVVSTTFVRGGSAYNIIPGQVELGGTMRSLSKAGYRFIDGQVAKILRGAAAIGGCTLNLTSTSLEDDCLDGPAPEGAPGACTFPPTVNDPGAFRVARAAAIELAGEERFQEAAPTMGGEDFAYLAERVPGAMVFLGIGNHSLGTDVNLHNPRFQMDESAMQLGAALHVEMALRSLVTPLPPPRCKDSSLTGDGLQAQCHEGTLLEGED